MSTTTAVTNERTVRHGDGCPSCSAQFHAHQNYCTNCGFLLRVRCVGCNKRITPRGHTRCSARR